MKQRIWLFLLCLLLCGCGENTQTPPPTPAPETRTASTSAPPPTPTAVPEPAPSPAPTQTPVPTASPIPEPPDDTLVPIREWLPGAFTDLRYATTNNFTGQVIYDFTEPLLRYGTVKKLAQVERALREQGFTLLIWDAYRPVLAQFRLWEICPDSTYVANPNTGFSSHSRGNTVDLTLVTLSGGAVEMPSGFDEFSALADRDYSDVSETAAQNARLLEQAMTEAGFVPYDGEWWHYSDSVKYEVVS